MSHKWYNYASSLGIHGIPKTMAIMVVTWYAHIIRLFFHVNVHVPGGLAAKPNLCQTSNHITLPKSNKKSVILMEFQHEPEVV